MAYEPISFWDRRNPLFGGQNPYAVSALAAKPTPAAFSGGATGEWNQAMGPGGLTDPAYAPPYSSPPTGLGAGPDAYIAQAARRNAALTTAPRTPRPRPGPAQPAQPAAPAAPAAPGDPSVPGEAGPLPAVPETSVANLPPGTQQMPAEPQTNVFGLTPEQMQESLDQQRALQTFQMGLSGTGSASAEADKLADFGRSINKNSRGGYGKKGAAAAFLGGAAEGATTVMGMMERRKIAEQIKALRDAYQLQEGQRAIGKKEGGRVFEDDPSMQLAQDVVSGKKDDEGAADALQRQLDEEMQRQLQNRWMYDAP
jgi:hypothetical protein